MRKIISLLSAIVISVVSFAGIANSADSKKPIVIPTHNWSSQIVMAYVIGGIMESMGCLLYTSPSPRDLSTSRMPSSA